MAEPAGEESDKPPLKRRARRWALELLVVLGVYFSVQGWRSRDALPSDELAPAFSLSTPDGQRVSLADFEGKRVLLHFWATWCGVCKAELPMLRAIEEGLSEDEVLLTVVASDDPSEVRTFAKERELDYPIVIGTPEVLSAYRISAFPTNYVIDSAGKIVAHTTGLSTRLGLWARMGCAR